jgi:hypothetical protein
MLVAQHHEPLLPFSAMPPHVGMRRLCRAGPRLPFAPRGSANEIPLCGDGSVIVVVSYVPVDQRRLSPGPSKIEQVAPLVFGLGAGSGNDRLFGVLPELICSRHRHTLRVPRHIPTSGCSPAGPMSRGMYRIVLNSLCIYAAATVDGQVTWMMRTYRNEPLA